MDHTTATPTDIVDHVLSLSKTSNAMVILDEGFEAEVRFANNTTTTNGQRRDRHVTVIAFDERANGTAVGIASKSGVNNLEDLVRAAERECRDSGIADDASPLISGGEQGIYNDEIEGTDMSVLSNILDALPDAFAQAMDDNEVLAGFAKHSVTTTFFGSTTGVRRRHVQPDGTLELVGRADGGKRSAWASAGTMDFSDVSFEALADRIRERLTWAKKKIDLPAGRYEVIMPPDAVADLMIPMDEAMSGRDAEDGQNVFSAKSGTRIGEQLSKLAFCLESDPNYPGLESSPFIAAGASGTDLSVFDNASPMSRTKWIDNGKLEQLRYHRAGALKSNAKFTPGGENLILSVPNPTGSLEDLIKRTKRGLLLTCLWYIREVDVNTLLLTGLTRDGVYLIEDGEVQGAVNNFRFNESPVDLLSKAIEAGTTERALSREWNEWVSRTAMPALRVADFNMSSVSPAS